MALSILKLKFVITQLVTGCSIFNCTKLIKSFIQKYIKEKGCVTPFPGVDMFLYWKYITIHPSFQRSWFHDMSSCYWWDYSRVLRSSSFTKLCHIFFKTYSCETRIWPKHLLPPQTFSCFPKHLSTSDELFGESTNVWATNKMFVLLDPTLDGIELWLSARPISKLPASCCDWSIITAASRLMSGMLLY